MEAANNEQENTKRKNVDETPDVPVAGKLTKNQRKQQAKKRRMMEARTNQQSGVDDVKKRAVASVPPVVEDAAMARKIAKKEKNRAKKELQQERIMEQIKKQRENQLQREEEERKKAKQDFEDLCSGLRDNTVTELDRCFTEDQAKTIGQALSGNTSLEDLTLHFKEYTPTLPELPGLTLDGVQALCDGVLQSQLKQLEICGGIKDANSLLCVFWTAEASQTITKLTFLTSLSLDDITCLGQALKNNAGIRELDIPVADLTDDEAEALSLALEQSHIVKLNIDGGRDSHQSIILQQSIDSTTAAFVTLFEAVQQKMQSLEVLSIENFTAKLSLITQLADGLRSSTTLKELVLKNGELLDVEAARVLSQGLRQNSSLTTLRILGSYFEDGCAVVLAANLSSLEELDLDEDGEIHNEVGSNDGARGTFRIGCSGVKLLREEIPNLRLRELDLTFWRDFTDDGNIDELSNDKIKAMYDEVRDTLLQYVKNNEYVWHLDISDETFNRGSFFEKLKYYLDLNRFGRRLVTMDHGLLSTIWCYILARAGGSMEDEDGYVGNEEPENVLSFMYHVLREQPHLVQGSQQG